MRNIGGNFGVHPHLNSFDFSFKASAYFFIIRFAAKGYALVCNVGSQRVVEAPRPKELRRVMFRGTRGTRGTRATTSRLFLVAK